MSIPPVLKDPFLKYVYSGLTSHDNTETVRQIYLINIFTLVAVLFSFILGFKALYTEHYPIAFALLSCTLILVINYYYLRLTHNREIAAFTITFLFFILMTYLVYSGGISNTGPLWIYAFPMIVLFLLGFKKGITSLLVFVSIIFVMMFFPHEALLNASYPHDFKVRIMLSFLLVASLSALYEYTRERSFLEMHKLSEQLELLSIQDQLTEVYNRRGIHKELEKACTEYKMHNKNFSLILCDIDHFKKVNDMHGHAAGDMILKKVAIEIQDIIRKEDVLARWGGEEFLIFLPNSDIEVAHTIGEEIRKSIEKLTFTYDDEMIYVTLSIGISEKSNETPVNNIIKQADENMYQAKREGRNMTFPNLKLVNEKSA